MADTSDLGKQAELLSQINSLLAQRCDLEAKIANSCGKQGAMAGEMAAATNASAQGLKDLGGGWSEVNSALDEGSRKQKDINKQSKGFLKGMLSKSKGIVGAAAGFGVFTKGLKFAAQGLKGVAMAGKSMIKGVFNISKAILKIPFKIFGGLIGMANKNAGAGTALRQAYEDVRKEFGSFSEGPAKNVIAGFNDMRSSAGNLAGTGLSASRVFGYGPEGMAKMMGAVADIAKGLGPAINLLGDEFGKVAEQAVMFSKGLGLSGEQMGKLMKDAKLSGKSQTDMMTEVGSMSLQMADKFGLSSKDIGRDIADMKSDFVSFGNVSTAEMGAASAYARSLGMDMKDLKGVVDKFDDFEGAAESVGQLNQAFGIQLDTMKMMNAENPAERIDMMRKAFFAAGKSIENMTRQEKKLMMQQTGLTESALKSAFAAENQGVAYEDFADAAAESEENQLSQEEVMLKLAKAIEKISAAGPGFTGMFDAFSKGFMKAVMYDDDMKDLFRTIRQMLRAVFKLGKVFGTFFVALLKGSGVIKALKEFFNPKIISTFTKTITPMLKGLANFLTTGKGNPEKLFDTFFGALDKMFSARGTAGKKVATAFGRLIEMLATLFAKLAEWAKPKIIPYLKGLITGVQKFFSGSGIGAGIADALGKLMVGAFVSAFKFVFSAAGQGIKALKKTFKAWYDKDAPNAIRAASTGANLLGVGTRIMGKFGMALNPYAALAMAASSFSKGFENMDKAVDKGITGVNRTLSVGAASYLELLTFGLMPDHISAKLGNFVGQLLDVLDGFFKKIGLGSFFDGFKQEVAGVIQIFKGIGDIVRGLFSGDAAKVQEGLESLMSGIFDTIVGRVKMIGTVLLQLVTRVLPWVGKLLMKILGTVVKWVVTELPKAIIGAFVFVGKKLVKGGQNLMSFFTDKKFRGKVWKQAKDFAGSIVMGLINGIKDFIVYLAEWLAEIWVTFADFWDINSPSGKMMQAGQDLVDGIMETFAALPQLILNVAREAWDSIKGAFAGVAAWGAGLVKSMFAPFATMASTIGGYAEDAWAAVKNAFNGVKKFFDSVGKAIINGVMAPIRAIKRKIRQVFDALPDVIKDRLVMRSPSKVFAEIGQGMSDGMTQQFDKEAISGVGKTMDATVKTAQDGLKGGNYNTGIGEAIVSEIKSLGPMLAAASMAAIVEMGESFKDGSKYIGALFTGLFTGEIGNLLGSVFGSIPGKITSLISGVFPILKDAFATMGKLVYKGMSFFMKMFKGDSIVDVFSKIMNTVGAVAKRVLQLVTKQMMKLSKVIGIMGKKGMGMSKLSIFSRQNKNIFKSLAIMFRDMVKVLRRIKFAVVHDLLESTLYSVQMIDKTFKVVSRLKPSDLSKAPMFKADFRQKVLDGYDRLGEMLADIGYITAEHLGNFDNRPTEAMFKAVMETSRLSKVIKQQFAGGSGTVVRVVEDLVDTYNKTYEALEDAANQPANLAIKLDNFASKVGINRDTFTVKNEKLNFEVNVAVVLNVDELGKTLTNRKIMGARTLKKALG